MSEHTKRRVNESADKIVLKTKLTRGTGTRDQEKFDVKVKGNDTKEVVQKMEDLLARLGENTAAQARNIQTED